MERELFDDLVSSNEKDFDNDGISAIEIETNSNSESQSETNLGDLSLKSLMLELISSQTILNNKIEEIIDLQSSERYKEAIANQLEHMGAQQDEQLLDLGNKMCQLISSDIKSQQYFAKLLRIQEVNSNLHNELSLYKSGLFEEIKLPIFRSIWRVRRTIVDELKFYKKNEEETKTFVEILEDILGEIVELLEENQLEIFTSNIGDDFNRVFDKKYNDIETNRQELNRKIAKIHNSGLKKTDFVIEKQVVDVYKFVENL